MRNSRFLYDALKAIQLSLQIITNYNLRKYVYINVYSIHYILQLKQNRVLIGIPPENNLIFLCTLLQPDFV